MTQAGGPAARRRRPSTGPGRPGQEDLRRTASRPTPGRCRGPEAAHPRDRPMTASGRSWPAPTSAPRRRGPSDEAATEIDSELRGAELVAVEGDPAAWLCCRGRWSPGARTSAVAPGRSAIVIDMCGAWHPLPMRSASLPRPRVETRAASCDGLAAPRTGLDAPNVVDGRRRRLHPAARFIAVSCTLGGAVGQPRRLRRIDGEPVLPDGAVSRLEIVQPVASATGVAWRTVDGVLIDWNPVDGRVFPPHLEPTGV